MKGEVKKREEEEEGEEGKKGGSGEMLSFGGAGMLIATSMVGFFGWAKRART